MYTIGVVVSSDEIIAYPQLNLTGFNFNTDLYEFVVYQQEQYGRLFAEMKLGALDGVVFSSNVSNDERIRNLLLANKDAVSKFICMGKGVLVLLQYHQAQKNLPFDIIDKSIFEDKSLDVNEEAKDIADSLFDIQFIKEDKQNNIVLKDDGAFYRDKIFWNENSVILSYPNKLAVEKIYYQSQHSQFAQSFAPAYISRYYHSSFVTPFAIEKDDNGQRKPLLIYSPDDNKRVVITTIPADLQEHKELLENLISYITRGRPDAILWKDAECDNCTSCIAEDYLKRAKIHYFCVDKNSIENNINTINRAKYVVACSSTGYETYRSSCNEIALPVKAPLSYINRHTNTKEQTANSDKIIVEVPSVSQIELWANQGFNYLLERFPSNDKLNNKWDTLYATEQVILLAEEIHKEIPAYIKEQIENYLRGHNNDGKSFDNVSKATSSAKNICKKLGFEELENNFVVSGNENSQVNEPKSFDGDIVTATLFDLAHYIIDIDDAGKLNEASEINDIIARFVTERDAKKASWEDDVMTTASVLRALLRIDKSEYNTSFTNIICSCYDKSNSLELTVSLSNSIKAARQSEYETRKQLIEKRKEYDEIKHDFDSQKQQIDYLNEDAEKLKNKHLVWRACFFLMLTLVVLIGVMLISYIVYAGDKVQESGAELNYFALLNDFFISWGLGQIIAGIASIGVEISLFAVFFVKHRSQQEKKEERSRVAQKRNVNKRKRKDKDNK